MMSKYRFDIEAPSMGAAAVAALANVLNTEADRIADQAAADFRTAVRARVGDVVVTILRHYEASYRDNVLTLRVDFNQLDGRA